MSDFRTWNILNLGAGVQSTAVYLLACDVQRWGPNSLDFAVFADTGEEPTSVYAHLSWLKLVGTIPIMVRTCGRLGDDLKNGRNATGRRVASIPSFLSNGGMARRQCSKEYKVEVIERAIRRDIIGLAPRQRIPKDVHVNQYYGISLDEARRARRIEEGAAKHKWLTVKFPLLQLGWTRTDCLRFLSDKVPHRVQRSACVFCPYHSDAEWLQIKSNPADWKRAVEIDESIRRVGSVANQRMAEQLYVHRSCVPLVEASFNPKPTVLEQQINLAFTQECEGVCGT